jgi:hypothetical protein
VERGEIGYVYREVRLDMCIEIEVTAATEDVSSHTNKLNGTAQARAILIV